MPYLFYKYTKLSLCTLISVFRLNKRITEEFLINRSLIKLSSSRKRRKCYFVAIRVTGSMLQFFFCLALITLAHYEAITILKNTNNRLFIRTPCYGYIAIVRNAFDNK